LHFQQQAATPVSLDRRPGEFESAAWIARTAMCAEPRNGVLYLFMPPVEALEDYLELVAAIEATAAELGFPVVLEGYEPPKDPRLQSFRITPDPGVLEVNVHPTASWSELVVNTEFLYEQAREARLTTEKFMLAWWRIGITIRRCRSSSPACSSARPARRRASMRRATTWCMRSRSRFAN